MNAGWYLDPSGRLGHRYFDGERWTHHYSLTPPAGPPPLPSVPVGASTNGGTRHELHAALMIFTCGLWLPIWIMVAILSESPGSAMGVGRSAGGVTARTGRIDRTLLIVAGVLVGLMVWSVIGEHPRMLVLLVPMVGAGGIFYWKYKLGQIDEDQEHRERPGECQQ